MTTRTIIDGSTPLPEFLTAELELWKAFLAIPSLSMASQHLEQCLSAAQWLEQFLTSMGATVTFIQDGSSPPIIIATLAAQTESNTHVAYYGHYDVVDPGSTSEWDSPPFEPTLRDGRMYARGAQDNKGQLTAVLMGLRETIKRGALQCKVSLVIEGQEECGSELLSERMYEVAQAVGPVDALLVTDTGMMHINQPAITVGLRGIATCEVKLQGPRTTLHSGIHGGLCPNPAVALAKLIATFHDEQGAVKVPVLRENIQTLSPTEQQAAGGFPLTEDMYKTMVGIPALLGDPSLSLVERRGVYPSLDVTGITSGYNGDGVMSIIPQEAVAKVSCRIVPKQDPEEVIRGLEQYCQEQLPKGVRMTFRKLDGYPALRLSLDSTWLKQTRAMLEEQYAAPSLAIYEGASIPILIALSEALKTEPLLVGFGLEEDQMHGPNESFSLQQFSDAREFALRFFSHKW